MASSSGILKRKHKCLTIESKVEILNRLDKGEKGSFIAKEYGVGDATVSNIKKDKKAILNFASKLDSENGSKQRKIKRGAKDTLLEDAVYLWFTRRRRLGKPVSGPLICSKALYFNNTLGGPTNFKASSGWLKNFKLRHGIRKCNVQGEEFSSDSYIAGFQKHIVCFISSECVYSDQVNSTNNVGLVGVCLEIRTNRYRNRLSHFRIFNVPLYYHMNF